MLIFIVPALTMRLFAEEKKMKTMDLLLTSPIASWEIVVGKYLAAVVAVSFLVLIALVYPLTTLFFASGVSIGALLICFLGIFFVGMVYAAIDLFCSSLTESAIVAYVMAVMFNVALWFLSAGSEISDGALSRKIFEHISLSSHLTGLVEGTLRTTSLVFLGSVIALFNFLTERVVEASRWR
jgi:ABC-2 type transport system permease protein